MKIPRHHRWYEAGNTLYRTGSISLESTPIHLWLIDRWFYLADEAVHLIQRPLPKDEHGWDVIDRLSPYFGNPICAAYLSKWTQWYWKHQTQEVNVEVPFEKLSKDTQEWLLKDAERWNSDD